MTTLISLLITLIIIGLVFYLIQLLPFDARYKQIIYAVAIVCAIIYLLNILLRGDLGLIVA